jgi:hypothetical protein
MELGYFDPITNRGNLSVKKGTLSAGGNIEYSPRFTAVNLKDLEIKGVVVDYLHLPQTAEAEEERIQKAAQKAKELSNKPETRLRIDVLKIRGSTFGYVNRTTEPSYRLFIENADMTLKNFSNQFEEGPASMELKGKFMGTGETKVTGTFRPVTDKPDFDLNVAIDDTHMPAMSDLFRAFGNFDIKDGYFSFYSELTIQGDTINGYVKPLFRGMKVYDRRDREQKGLFHKIYVGLVGGIARLLENVPRDEVATKTDISGPVEKPHSNTLQTIFNLIRNAFIKSILPGFEKEVTGVKTPAQASESDRSSPEESKAPR